LSNLDPGGFSEIFRVPSWNIKQGGVFKLKSKISLEEASLIEPLGCCIRGVSKCGIVKDSTALIIGAGPIGIINLQLMHVINATVFISDVNEERLEFAKNYGAYAVYNPEEVDVPSMVKENTNGIGVDLAFVATGNPKAIIQALRSVRKGGKVCLFGVPVLGSILDYDFSTLFNSEISIIPSYGAIESNIKRALNLIEKQKLDLKNLVTHRYKLENFTEAMDTYMKGIGQKIIIMP
jgi:L-iditol 2-dehydrogenase